MLHYSVVLMLSVTMAPSAGSCEGVGSDGIHCRLQASENTYATSQVPVLLLTVRNDADVSRTHVQPDPMKYGLKHPAYQPAMHFEIHERKAGVLAVKYKGKDPAFFVRVVLKPGERITYLVPFNDVLRNCAGPIGVGEYRATHTISAKAELAVEFEVSDRVVVSRIAIEDLTADEIMKKLAGKDITAGQRYKVLSDVYQDGRKDLLWQLLTSCDDVYAVVTQMSVLGGEWLDVAGLKKLTLSKDLAIRRAAIRAFGRLGADADAAKWLEAFLKTQEDELTSKQGKGALGVLRGKTKPAEPKPYVDGRPVEVKVVPVKPATQ